MDFLLHSSAGWACVALAVYPALLLWHLGWFLVFLLLSRLGKGALRQYLVNLAISHDQRLNALTGGDPDSTVSARLGRAYGWAMVEEEKGTLFWIFVLPVTRLLHWLDPYHVEIYALADRSEGKKAIFGYKPLGPKHWKWLEGRKALVA